MWQITQQKHHKRSVEKWLNTLKKKNEDFVCNHCKQIIVNSNVDREFHYTKLCLRKKD